MKLEPKKSSLVIEQLDDDNSYHYYARRKTVNKQVARSKKPLLLGWHGNETKEIDVVNSQEHEETLEDPILSQPEEVITQIDEFAGQLADTGFQYGYFSDVQEVIEGFESFEGQQLDTEQLLSQMEQVLSKGEQGGTAGDDLTMNTEGQVGTQVEYLGVETEEIDHF